MSVEDDRKITAIDAKPDCGPNHLSRRALIKKGAVAMPAILTLQSGAALARSSNLISASPRSTRDQLGRTLCLDTNSVVRSGDQSGVFDMGHPPRAVVNIISDRDHHIDKNFGSDSIHEGEMCRGGLFWHNEKDGTGWQSVELPYRGIVISSGAMTSHAAYITDHLM